MDRNQKLYKFYRMVGYDYLFYHVIIFLFFTVTKNISAGEVMYLSSISALFVFLFQIPLNYIVERIGLKSSMTLRLIFLDCSYGNINLC